MHGYVPGTIGGTPLAELNGASELLASPLLDQDKFPALIEDLLDSFRDVDNGSRRDEVVIFLNVPVIQLFVPEAVRDLAILLETGDFDAVPDLALAP